MSARKNDPLYSSFNEKWSGFLYVLTFSINNSKLYPPPHQEAEVQTEAKQRELFDGLDREYQMARMTTHTHRGIGLGFGSVSYQPLSQPAPAHPPTTSPS